MIDPPVHAPRGHVRCVARPLCAALAVIGLAALPASAPAAAKSRNAMITDASGDAPSPGVDLVQADVRYRSVGSLRVQLTTAGPINVAADDAQLVVSISRRLHGKCDRTVLNFVGQLSNPVSVAFTQRPGKTKSTPKYGLPRFGTASVSGNTYEMKIKRPAFSKLSVGCVYVALVSPGATPALIDDALITAFH